MQCLFTLAVIVCASLQPLLVHSCDEDHVRMCEDEFASAVGVTREELEAAVTPDLNEEYLRGVCEALDGYKECIRSYDGYCPYQLRLQIEGLENMFDYICEDGFDDHLKHGNCINSDSVGPGIIRCNNELYVRLALFADSKGDSCDIVKDGIECIGDEVEKFCGEDAAEHRKQLEILALEPVADEFDCNLEDDGLSGAAIAGIIIGVILLIILCIGICYFCAQHTNNKRHRNNPQVQVPVAYMITQVGGQAPQVPQAPPYPGPPSSSPPAYTNTTYQDPDFAHSTKPPVAQNHSYMLPTDDQRDSHVYIGNNREPLAQKHSYQTPEDNNRRESHTYEAIDKI